MRDRFIDLIRLRWWLLVLLGWLILGGCGREDGRERLVFWVFGREGEQVRLLIEAFELEHPDLRVDLQQIPWSAAYERLLTAYVGGQLPDVAQMGNSWLAQFAELHVLEDLSTWIREADLDTTDFFEGVWMANRIDGRLCGLPWYVDTRVIFYRTDLLRRAGYERMPTTWMEWSRLMQRLVDPPAGARYALWLLPDWSSLVIFGMQNDAPLLGVRGAYGNFRDERFRRAFRFYLHLFDARLVPLSSTTQLGSVYQEFARGQLALFISGPWSVGELRDRLPDSLQNRWATAPLPGPDGPGVSLAGGASLVIFRGTRHPEAARKLVRFLTRPDVQLRFYELTGDLPVRRSVWQLPPLRDDRQIDGFREQLARIRPLPAIPEWEAIAARIQYYAEAAKRGLLSPEEALTMLDREVDLLLDKRRRWISAGRYHPAAHY